MAAGDRCCNLTVGDFAPGAVPHSRRSWRPRSSRPRGGRDELPAVGRRGARCARRSRASTRGGSGSPTRPRHPDRRRRAAAHLRRRTATVVDPGDTRRLPGAVVEQQPLRAPGRRARRAGASAAARRLPAHRASSSRRTCRRRALLALNSPLNPTGTAFDRRAARRHLPSSSSRRTRAAAPASEPLFLLYDQVYWMLTFGDAPHVDAASSCVPEMAPYTIFVDGIVEGVRRDRPARRLGGRRRPPVIARMRDILGHVGAWAPQAEQVAAPRSSSTTTRPMRRLPGRR